MSSFCTGEDSAEKAEEHSEDESFFGLDDDCQTPCTGRAYVLLNASRKVTLKLGQPRALEGVFSHFFLLYFTFVYISEYSKYILQKNVNKAFE